MKVFIPIFLVCLVNSGFGQLHTYHMNGSLNETSGAGPTLTQIVTCGAAFASFTSEVISTSAGVCSPDPAPVYAFPSGNGLSYANNIITGTYTIHIFFKFNNYSQYQRIIDFRNSATDNGLYTRDACLNFYPDGDVGACPFFVTNTYYLLSLVRDGATNQMAVYVNGTLFGNYNDVSQYYACPALSTPILLFKDDSNPGSVPCENQSGSIKYFAVKSGISAPPEITDTWNSICALALPLRLVQFSAIIKNNEVFLDWTTSEEQRTHHTEIERNTTGNSFILVGKVASMNSIAANHYQFKDNTELFRQMTQTVQYRLKFVDQDGKFTYSPIRKVSVEKNTGLSLQNPGTDNLFFDFSVRDKLIVATIYDFQGKKCISQTMRSVGRGNRISISRLPAGIYIIKVDDGLSQRQSKFLKY